MMITRVASDGSRRPPGLRASGLRDSGRLAEPWTNYSSSRAGVIAFTKQNACPNHSSADMSGPSATRRQSQDPLV